jgi:hypothetical protein
MAAGGYRKIEDLPTSIAVFPLDGALLLPGATLQLQIFEPRYLNMVDDVMAGDRLIGMVQTRPGGDRRRPRLARVGCVGRITSYSETGDGKYLIALSGLCRFESGEELAGSAPYRQLRVDYGAFEDDFGGQGETMEFERAPFLQILRRYLDNRGLGVEWEAVNAAPAEALVNSLCMGLPFDPPEKQALLEAPGFDERRIALAALLEIDAADIAGDDDEPPPLQ